MDVTIWSRPEYAQITGHVNNMRFENQKILKQGHVPLDTREILRDDSHKIQDMQNFINNVILRDINAKENRIKHIYELYFDEFEVKIVDGLLFAGATFDPLYLGRPQNWPS